MINLNSGRFISSMLSVFVLIVSASCASNPGVKAEAWEVMVQYPVHHYYSGPVDERIFQLSPDGTKLASLESHGDFINLIITDISSGTRQLATNFDDVMVTGYTWANNNRLLFYTSDELAIYAVDYNGHEGRNYAYTTVVCKDECLATENPVFLVSYVQVMSRLPAKPDLVLVSSNRENILQPSLYELNIHTGNLTPVKTGGGNPEIYRWPVDDEQRILRAGTDADQVASILQFKTSTGEWSEIPAGDDTYQSIADTNISRHLAKIQRELDVESIRVSSIDDKQSKAVLITSSGQSTADYYLYDFESGSISLLARNPLEVAMIEENPSQIRVELIVVNQDSLHRPGEPSFPPYLTFGTRDTNEISARKEAHNPN